MKHKTMILVVLLLAVHPPAHAQLQVAGGPAVASSNIGHLSMPAGFRFSMQFQSSDRLVWQLGFTRLVERKADNRYRQLISANRSKVAAPVYGYIDSQMNRFEVAPLYEFGQFGRLAMFAGPGLEMVVFHSDFDRTPGMPGPGMGSFYEFGLAGIVHSELNFGNGQDVRLHFDLRGSIVPVALNRHEEFLENSDAVVIWEASLALAAVFMP